MAIRAKIWVFRWKQTRYLYRKRCKNKRKKPTKGIGINKYDLEGNLLSTYISISEASRDTFGNPHRRNQILKCCNGEAQEYSGYKWEYCPAEE